MEMLSGTALDVETWDRAFLVIRLGHKSLKRFTNMKLEEERKRG